jgi:hypothetical protein
MPKFKMNMYAPTMVGKASMFQALGFLPSERLPDSGPTLPQTTPLRQGRSDAYFASSSLLIQWDPIVPS